MKFVEKYEIEVTKIGQNNPLFLTVHGRLSVTKTCYITDTSVQ